MISQLRRFLSSSIDLRKCKTISSVVEPISICYKPFNSFTIKKKSSKQWMNEHINDIYVKKAKLYNYRSRAAFKLIEINQRYNILKPGYKVLDLGCAPGGWSQVAVEKVNSTIQNPLVLSIDKLAMTEVPGSHFIQGDIEDEIVRIKIKEFFKLGMVDVVISDMAPNFSGDMDIDHLGISALNKMCLKICSTTLRPGGTLLMKTLHGALEGEFFPKNYYKVHFKNFQRIKPSSSRARSSEIFYLGTGYKLNETYIMLKKFEQLVENGQVTDDDIKKMGKEGEKLKIQLENLVKKSSLLEVPIEDFYLPFLKAFKIDYVKPEMKDQSEIDAEKLKDILNKANIKFSFMKEIPKNLKELKEYSDKKEKSIQRKLEAIKTGIEDNSLFLSDDENIEEGEFEKMDILADIDDIPNDLFKEEFDEEEKHHKETIKEIKDELSKLRKKTGLENEQDNINLTNDYFTFEEYMEKNPQEWNKFTRAMSEESSWKEVEDELDKSFKNLNFEEAAKAKEELRILRHKNEEFRQYFKKGDNYENLWKKK